MVQERERKGERNDERNKRKSDSETTRVEKIFAYTRDDTSGTEKWRERKIERGGENTHSKMSSSDPDLRWQGNRRCPTSSRVRAVPETAKFLFELSSARMARDKKDVSGP